ncbi:MAG: substrate-binding domain-containing protein [Lachnospiraceae bacterium]|nr:substrate-binding domain-containing protein [Lachnospiraceae bacterium]
MKKNVRLTAILLAVIVSLCACARAEDSEDKTGSVEEEKIRIGMCFDSFVIERWQRDRDVFVQAAKDLGAEVNVQNANGDIEEQKKQIAYFIEKGMDVIVIVCIDSDALSDSVKAARNAGIKVIAYDRLINNADIDLYISFDNEMVGTLMGEALVESGLGAGSRVIMAGGSPTDNNVSLIDSAFIKVMQENSIEIIDMMHCDGWRAELAAEYVDSHRDLVSECDAIMCGNDNLASQVVNALSVQRLAGRIEVTGQDADLEACQRIVEGTQLMTVYKPVEKLATRAAECAVILAKKGSLTGDDIGSIGNGKGEVPYVKLEPLMVTKENMDRVIIDSGFHRKDEVYLNVK